MEGDFSALAAQFAMQIGVILIVAKVVGEIFERVAHQPAVLGELTAGVLIGPYALGGIDLPIVGPLFPVRAVEGFAIPEPIWVFAQMGAVILLFGAGLETDFGSFVRFGPRAVVVALGGVVLPFAAGDVTTVALGLAPDYLSAEALFVGAALTATSVGVTARILGDMGKLDAPEGVTILGAAVFDDVIGILILAIVVAIVQGGGVSPTEIGVIAVQAVAVWVILTGILVLAAHRIADVFARFRTAGAPIVLAIGLALIAGVVAHDAGLAMIVGAFSAGVALSRSRLRRELEHPVRTVQQVMVPAFFVVIGMLVDVGATLPLVPFGILLTVVAVAGKVIGCSLPALGLGFKAIGALRVGIGMVPRGEVALIIAGIGLASGAVDEPVFSTVVFMAFVTTVIVPPLLVYSFRRGGIGFGTQLLGAPVRVLFELPPTLSDHFEGHLVGLFAARGFGIAAEWSDEGRRGRELRRGDEIVSVVATHGVGQDRVQVESESEPEDWHAILAGAAERAGDASQAVFTRLHGEASADHRTAPGSANRLP